MRGEGVRRLSIAMGLVFPSAGLFLRTSYQKGFRRDPTPNGRFPSRDARILRVGWGLVRLIAWVIEGFRKDRGQ